MPENEAPNEGTGQEGSQPPAPTPTLPQDEVNRLVGTARVEARSALLKKFGVASEDELRAALEERDALRQSQMSEVEKAQADAAKWQKKAEEAQAALESANLAAMRASIAREKGLPEKLIKAITGTDEDTITAEVEELLPLISQGPPDLGDGTRPPSGGALTAEERFAAELQAAYAASKSNPFRGG